MPILIIILLSGFFIGKFFNENKLVLKSKSLIMPIVLTLLFFMGITIGTNNTLLNNFLSLGAKAVLITFGSLVGTIFFALLAGKVIDYLIQIKKR